MLSVVALHVAIRMRPAFSVFQGDEHRPLLASTDSFYHAHRAHLLFESAPNLVFHDRYMFYPEGAIAQWSLGLDYLTATVLRLLTPFWEKAVWWLPFVTPLISLVALLVFYALAREYFSEVLSIAVTACFALNLAFVRVSTPAEYDHHVVETLCVALLLLLPTRLTASHSSNLAATLGAALAWTVWTSTLLVFVVAAFFFIYLIFVRLGSMPKPTHLGACAIGCLAPLSVLVIIESSARGEYFSVITLSLFHLTLVALSLLGLALATRFSGARLWMAAGALMLLGVALLPSATRWAIGFLLGSDSVLGHVNETRPLFMDGNRFSLRHAHAFLGPGIVLFPWAVWQLWKRSHRPNDTVRFLAFFVTLLVVLALAQKRLVHLCVPGFVFVLCLSAALTVRSRPWVALVIVLLLEPAVVFFPETAQAIPDSARISMHVAKVLREAAHGDASLGVSAPPGFGSAINYAADLPSVTNAFFYPKYLRADLTLREIESTAAMIGYLRGQRIGYLVTVDDPRYLSMLLGMLAPADKAAKGQVWERTPCSGELMRYAYYRVACGVEAPSELEPLFQTQTSADPKRLWRRLSVFRLRIATASRVSK